MTKLYTSFVNTHIKQIQTYKTKYKYNITLIIYWNPWQEAFTAVVGSVIPIRWEDDKPCYCIRRCPCCRNDKPMFVFPAV